MHSDDNTLSPYAAACLTSAQVIQAPLKTGEAVWGMPMNMEIKIVTRCGRPRDSLPPPPPAMAATPPPPPPIRCVSVPLYR